jgi:hypothetical protein
MEDCTGREIKVGHRVAFSVGPSLLTGEVVVSRTARRYRRDIPLVKVALDKPEARYKHCARIENGFYVRDADGNFVYDAELIKTNTHRDVIGSERIIILTPLDNSTK